MNSLSHHSCMLLWYLTASNSMCMRPCSAPQLLANLSDHRQKKGSITFYVHFRAWFSAWIQACTIGQANATPTNQLYQQTNQQTLTSKTPPNQANKQPHKTANKQKPNKKENGHSNTKTTDQQTNTKTLGPVFRVQRAFIGVSIR